MAFRPPKKQPQFTDLKGILAQSKQTDNALYQTVQILIERIRQFQQVTLEDLRGVEDSALSEEEAALIFASKFATFLTEGDETADLPNSRQLLAGAGITFDTSVPNKLTISSTSGSAGDTWSVLTNGDVTNPELIFADGDVIMVNF